MCVAIPGRVISISEGPGPSRPAQVVFGDDEPREVDLAMLPDTEIGDYVIVHSGFGISSVNEESALESYRLFRIL
jgi:hydrogenase expression/formation protein HypC